MFAPVTKARCGLADVGKATVLARVPPSGPVYVEIPTDLLTADTSPDLSAAASAMRAPEVEIIVDLHLGDGMFTGWFSDLNEGYVKVNAGYLT